MEQQNIEVDKRAISIEYCKSMSKDFSKYEEIKGECEQLRKSIDDLGAGIDSDFKEIIAFLTKGMSGQWHNVHKRNRQEYGSPDIGFNKMGLRSRYGAGSRSAPLSDEDMDIVFVKHNKKFANAIKRKCPKFSARFLELTKIYDAIKVCSSKKKGKSIISIKDEAVIVNKKLHPAIKIYDNEDMCDFDEDNAPNYFMSDGFKIKMEWSDVELLFNHIGSKEAESINSWYSIIEHPEVLSMVVSEYEVVKRRLSDELARRKDQYKEARALMLPVQTIMNI